MIGARLDENLNRLSLRGTVGSGRSKCLADAAQLEGCEVPSTSPAVALENPARIFARVRERVFRGAIARSNG